MSTEAEPQMVVEDGMDATAMARIKSMQEENPELKNIEFDKPEFESLDTTGDVNLDAPKEDVEPVGGDGRQRREARSRGRGV